MSLTPKDLSQVLAVLRAETTSFVKLSRLAGLDPKQDFRGADYRRVVFTAEDDLSGFDFRGADLRDADLRLARGLAAARWEGARLDGVRWPVPEDFDLGRAQEMILAGRAPPPHWWPLIIRLEFELKKFEALSDLSPIASLNALQRLWLNNTQVADLSPIANLNALQTLDLNNTQVADLSPIANLNALQTLHLNNTQVADLSPIANLNALQTLTLNNTQVADLSPIAGREGLTVYWRGEVIDAATLRPGKTPGNTARPRAARRR